jgi:2-polyprenyl-6-methoxyphenol hydroxylase-like FAD-dependent oxidoreductase
MMRHPLKVLILGAGTGGLCLAQGLKSDGVAVEVFERDDTPSDRQQGYRLSLSATGSSALKTCLPDALFAKLVESSAHPSQGITFLDHRMNRLLAIDFPRSDRKAIESELPVSRITLRRILLEGLDDIVHFGKKFVAFEDAPNGAVTACSRTGRRPRAMCSSVRTVPALICAHSSCRMLSESRPASWPSAESSA